MKCLKFTFLLFQMFYSANSLGQNYLNESSKWYALAGDTYEKWYEISKFQINGDTLVNDTVYHKIHREYNWLRLDYDDDTDTVSYYTGLEEIRLLREESGKFYTRNSNKDICIIDFNLEIGSEVNVDGFNAEIYEIDTIQIENETRRVFKTNFYHKIYEGIGTTKGLFEGLTWLGPHPAHTLICYQHNGVNYQLHESYIPGGLSLESCDSLIFKEILTSSFIPIRNNEFRVFPNPFTEEVTIDLGDHSTDKIRISIYDLSGRRVMIRTVNKLDHEIELQLSQLNKGVYFLELEFEGFIYNRKLIKI
jgi:hypothetical protein